MLTDDEARESVIIALDCDRDTAIDLATRLQGKARWVKVGMTLFYAEGPSIVREMRDRGFKVFLDLKLHDIPFQVRGAARSASLTGADLLSIHGMGSSEMVRQARAGVEDAAGERGDDRTRLPRSASTCPWSARWSAWPACPWARAPTASCARRRRPRRCASSWARRRSS